MLSGFILLRFIHIREKKIQELTCVEVDRIEAEAGLAPPTEIDKIGGVGAMSNDECAAMSP